MPTIQRHSGGRGAIAMKQAAGQPYDPWHLLEFTVILPTQFAKSPPPSGEWRLMVAMLETAVADLRLRPVLDSSENVVRQRATLSDRARAWVTETDAAWPFSFVNICGAL